MAATITTEKVWGNFLGSHTDGRAFYHGHTFGGNPLAAAVALESLNIFQEERLLATLQERIAQLQHLVKKIAKLPHVGDTRQCGLVAGIDLVAKKQTGHAYPWENAMGTRACLAARRHGALLRQLGDTVVIMPPLSINSSELTELLCAAESAIREITEC